MKKIFLLCAVLALLGAFSQPAAYGASGQAVIGEIQKLYETANDFEADFQQEYIGKVMMRSQKGEGKVYFKKRGMMRWDYRVPNYQLITNGHTLWYYQPEDKQVFVSEVSKVIKEKTPLAFLAGEGKLTRDFTLIHLNESKEGQYVLELAPKEANPALGKLSLTVDRKTYLIVQVDVFDELGNVTRTRFLSIKTNVGLPESLFQFVKPPGTEELKIQES